MHCACVCLCVHVYLRFVKICACSTAFMGRIISRATRSQHTHTHIQGNSANSTYGVYNICTRAKYGAELLIEKKYYNGNAYTYQHVRTFLSARKEGGIQHAIGVRKRLNMYFQIKPHTRTHFCTRIPRTMATVHMFCKSESYIEQTSTVMIIIASHTQLGPYTSTDRIN